MVFLIFSAPANFSDVKSAMNLRQGIGLLLVFTIYLLVGGAIFMVLEETPVVILSETYAALTLFKERLLTNHTVDLFGVGEEEWEAHVNDVFGNVSEIYLNQNTTMGRWNFYDSTFFCLTVVTTIGYGNKYPTNENSRGFCIIYALIGIPLTGIWMTVIGNFFSKKLLKAHEKTRSSSSPRLALIINTITYLIPGFVIFLLLPAAVFMGVEDWTYLEGFYYAVITLTTIGFGDLVAGQNNPPYNIAYKIGIMIWIIFGLGYLAMILNFIAKAMKSKHVKKLEQTLTKNLKQTQDAFSKEVDYLIKTMNELIKKGKHEEYPRIKSRRSSLPTIERSPVRTLKRSLSTGSLAAPELTPKLPSSSAENPASFIFDLAMAIACGEIHNNDGSRTPPVNIPTDNSSPSNVAQLLTLALLPQLKANSDQNKSPQPTSAKSITSSSKFDFRNLKVDKTLKSKATKSQSVVGNFMFPFGLTPPSPPPTSSSYLAPPDSGLGPRRPSEHRSSIERGGSLFKNMIKRQLERSESSPLSKVNYEMFSDKLSQRGSKGQSRSPLASCSGGDDAFEVVTTTAAGKRSPSIDDSNLLKSNVDKSSKYLRAPSSSSLGTIDESSVIIPMPTTDDDGVCQCQKKNKQS